MLYHHIIEHPESKERVVFIHGAGGSSGVWYKQIKEFKKHYNLLFIDLRGHGKSVSKNTLKRYYTFRTVALEIIEVLDHHNLKQCHFLGVSLGTIIIRELAEYDPSYVKSIIMAGAVMKFNVKSKILLNVADKVKHFLPYMWIYKIYANILMPKKRHKTSRNLFIKEAIKLKRNEFLNWMTLNNEINSLLNIFCQNELPIPVIYIMGDEDYMFLTQVKLLPNKHKQYSSLVVLKDAGHVCNVDQGEEFNKVALEFLSAVAA